MMLVDLILLVLFLNYSSQSSIINQSVFLNPINNSTFIQCPLNFTARVDIQWYDVTNQRYDSNRGRYYRIHSLEPFERQLICLSISKNESFTFILRVYDHPLPVQSIKILKTTNTTLTVQWNDDQQNRNANVTSYELTLKYDHLIQSRILVNNTLSIYTFSSLHPSTFYSIDISVIDIWKRSSRVKTVLHQTLPLTSMKQTFVNKIIDEDLLDRSISCSNIHDRLLFIDFNQSEFHMLNQINNLTVFNNRDQMIFTDILYSSLVYRLNEKDLKYKIQLAISTNQSEYLGKISKGCEDLSPFTCSIRSVDQNRYHLKVINHHKPRSTVIIYRINQTYFRKRNMRQLVTDEITDVKDNYSVSVQSNFLKEKLNLSIFCSITRIPPTVAIPYWTIICLVLLFLVLISLILLIVYQRFSSRENYHRKLCNDSPDCNQTDNFENKPVPIEEFEDYVSTMHRNNNLGFNRLFQTIEESTKSPPGYPTKFSQTGHNKSKNRYKDILPYDHSCVKLSKDEYINASYIDGCEKINAYIATQGPMMNTIDDFWRMIWEKDVSVIVMMTNIEERGTNKCEIYWPEDGTKLYGEIEVTLTSMNSFAYYIRRTFVIRSTTNEKLIDSERFVHQFHYTDWPDHGVPLHPLSVLPFIRRSSSCNSETGGPMVVHCSAGVGRTGTHIVIDTMIRKLNEQQPLDIPSFLKHIRKQRCNLVQTKEQFIFIYDTLLEVVQSMNLPNIEQQFELIRKSADGKPMYPSYIHGYYRANEFLITQHPTMDKRNDFWQMIWNNRTTVIVALYGDENLSSDIFNYWPLSSEIIDCGNIHVCLINEHFEGEYIYRDCSIRSTKDNDELHVRIISNSYWPDACSSIEASFHLIDTIKALHFDTPIVVHDQTGGYRAGTFCALYTMKEQMEIDGILNVYELAKFYYLKRPGIWRDNGDLLFLYRCADVLLHNSKT